jgi:type IX secretion system PorP/SprF family membrane protein
MGKRIYNICLLLVLAGSTLYAQQNIPTNLYLVNPVIYNPASASNIDGFAIYADYRHQWVGLKGAPEYFKFGAYGTFSQNMGLGINASGFKNGMLSNNELNLSFAYKINFSDNYYLSMGLSYGVYRFGINRKDFPVESSTDPTANSSLFDRTFFKTGFGLGLVAGNLQFDFAVPELSDQSKKTFFSSTYTYLSYDIRNLPGQWMLTPSAGYRRYYNTASYFDLGLTTSWQETVWLQVGYRTGSNVFCSAGISMERFIIAFSYEAPSTVLSSISGGSNEISVVYRFIRFSKENAAFSFIRPNGSRGKR